MVSPQEFKQAFEAAFLVNRKRLLWSSSQRRTAYMMAYIYRMLADSFPGLEVECEWENIDAVLYQSNAIDRFTNDDVVIAVEHENDVRVISTELTNFANHKFPLSDPRPTNRRRGSGSWARQRRCPKPDGIRNTPV